jgi:uncharacterized protein (DUF1015 family)
VSALGDDHRPGLDLAPFRAARFQADGAELAGLLSPPYDVIDEAGRRALLASDPRNVVALVLPERAPDGAPDYGAAAQLLTNQVAAGVLAVDEDRALYVYEMAPDGSPATRGLLGAVRLHPAGDGVIFPHEDTMAGPVADRLALMEATQANLEPIYLVYDGGGPASDAVSRAVLGDPIASTVTADCVAHRLWAIRDQRQLSDIAADLARHTAVIADGHHRYATYLELQARCRADRGPGPWDRGLTFLVDTTAHGPTVGAIHRVVPALELAEAARMAAEVFDVRTIAPPDPSRIDALDSPHASDVIAALGGPRERFAVAVTDGREWLLLESPEEVAWARALDDVPDPVAALDVTVVHRMLVASAWGRPDTVEELRYEHSVRDALAAARASSGVAVLLRPVPVGSVLAVARAGLRMPRKSTLFVPKPASGAVLRRFADHLGND